MAPNSLHNLKKRKRPAPPANLEDENCNDEDQIRVGSDYQADIPELLLRPENKHKQRPKSLKLWFPPKKISEVQLNDYILLSKNKYSYDTEQCLGLLYWNKHNLEKSIRDLSNFSPHPNWSILDKSNFESAFNKFGKDFVQINKMLPDKSLKSIICYYYSWKKKKTEGWTIKSVNKLEHICASMIENGHSDKSSSAKSEPDNTVFTTTRQVC
ncbi:REST corepressor-like isoform X1 [Acyrthosiphon pisum]|uniref:SANT domain-containing protein n=1 Tax=Acyrthosiphon pisum TaxID=7029 RepID=A0A8R2D3D0_ACYPI|nr:REST corepressor-like isoform X1 [Acyrthosiphon pisum]|eukprot:XP_016659529.1 PREDICTED: REST corepressor-like isoform X1 [Acyrthosiphon pisum]